MTRVAVEVDAVGSLVTQMIHSTKPVVSWININKFSPNDLSSEKVTALGLS